MAQESETLTFPGGQTARLARAADLDGLPDALAALGLASSRPVMVLVGGAAGLSLAGEAAAPLRELFHALAEVARAAGATVVDGGTDAGVMAFMGQARAEIGATFPLLGVAAEGTVDLTPPPLLPGERTVDLTPPSLLPEEGIIDLTPPPLLPEEGIIDLSPTPLLPGEGIMNLSPTPLLPGEGIVDLTPPPLLPEEGIIDLSPTPLLPGERTVDLPSSPLLRGEGKVNLPPSPLLIGEGKGGRGGRGEVLQPHHTHFLLVPGDHWGDESPWIARVATLLAGEAPSVTLLVNGGEISRQDVAHSLAAGRPVLVVAGTGRLADELAGSQERSPLLQVVDLAAGSDAVAGRLRAALGVE
jgi:hypothetical protein